MITFKQFIQDPALTEAIVKKWEVSAVEVNKAIEFLNANCKDGLKAISTGGLMYRGFSSGNVGGGGFAVIDSTKALRTSRDTNNSYQILMDNSPAMAEYPNRGNSFICSTRAATAESYGTAYVMIPINGAKIAVAPVNDIFHLHVKSDIYGGSPQDMSSSFGDLFSCLGVPKVKYDFVNAKAANEAFAAYTPDELAFMTYIHLKGAYDLNFKDDSDKLADAWDAVGSLEGGNTRMNPRTRKELALVINAYHEGRISKSEDIELLMALYTANPKKPFYALAQRVMTPATTKIKLAQFGDALSQNAEVWFSGKAMIIPFRVFAQILTRLKEQKYPINKKVLSDLEFDMRKVAKQEKDLADLEHEIKKIKK